jgi:hypothetical protein
MTNTILILAILAALALTACRPSQVTVSVTVPLGVKQNEIPHRDHNAEWPVLRLSDAQRDDMSIGTRADR